MRSNPQYDCVLDRLFWCYSDLMSMTRLNFFHTITQSASLWRHELIPLGMLENLNSMPDSILFPSFFSKIDNPMKQKNLISHMVSIIRFVRQWTLLKPSYLVYHTKNIFTRQTGFFLCELTAHARDFRTTPVLAEENNNMSSFFLFSVI